MSCEGDPGCLKHYARCREAKATILLELEPCFFRVSYVGLICGGWTMIWYWGKNETGFASGKTVEEAIADADRKVFGGL